MPTFYSLPLMNPCDSTTFILQYALFVPRRKSKGAIVMGLSVHPSFRLSVHLSVHLSLDTILSSQLLHFSRDFDEIIQLLFP